MKQIFIFNKLVLDLMVAMVVVTMVVVVMVVMVLVPMVLDDEFVMVVAVLMVMSS